MSLCSRDSRTGSRGSEAGLGLICHRQVVDAPPEGLFLPCHSFFLPACPAPCPDSLPLSSRLEDLPAGEIPPSALPPFWELWVGRGPEQSLQETASVKDAVKRGTFATSLALEPRVEFNSCVRTESLPHTKPRSTNASSRVCQSPLNACWRETSCRALVLWVLWRACSFCV